MPDRLFKIMLDWFMVSDLWQLDEESHEYISKWLDVESRNRGYLDWIDAYHEFEKDK